ncbi:hypothetical protein Tco_0593535, partial [Tanacetum coccineum]
MFDKAFKRVNTFVDFRTDLVEGSSKRAGEELEQESTKKQKVVDYKDTTKLQSLMKVIPDEEEVAIDVMYLVFSHMLKSFDREDLEDLYKLVKARYGSIRPMEDLDLVLWNDLKNMFEPHVEDEIWKLQQRNLMISEINIKFRGELLGLKVFLMLFGVTAALIDVNAAQSKFVLLENFNKNYSKCLRLLVKLQLPYKVNAAEGVNVASEEVSTAELGAYGCIL